MEENGSSYSSGSDKQALEEAYKKKLQQAQQQQQAEAQARMLLKTALDSQAYERVANIRISNPKMYSQLLQVIAYLYQNGQIQGKISQEQLKQLVSRLISNRRETTIKRI